MTRERLVIDDDYRMMCPNLMRLTMSKKKKRIRNKFRTAVFWRDHNSCRVCGAPGGNLNAHHITDRNEMPNGGYVVENGISLCPVCHEKAEQFHAIGVSADGFSPNQLYNLIGSSKQHAENAARKLT